jgi:hypothetical protein
MSAPQALHGLDDIGFTGLATRTLQKVRSGLQDSKIMMSFSWAKAGGTNYTRAGKWQISTDLSINVLMDIGKPTQNTLSLAGLPRSSENVINSCKRKSMLDS